MKRRIAIASIAFVLFSCVFTFASCKCTHTYSEWQTTATCCEAGVKTRVCSKCDEVQTESDPALGHDLGDLIPAKEPTCTEDGYVEHYHCARCGKDFAQGGDEIDPTVPASHKLESVAEIVTCAADGTIAHEHCTVCGKNFIDGVEKTDDELRIDAVDHNLYAVEAVEATCTSDGVIAHLHCDGCGKNFLNGVEKTDDELKIPASHNLFTVEAVEATCTSDGVIAHEHCTVCGKNFTDGAEKTDAELKISAGHVLEDDTGAAKTCTTDGVLAHKHCTVCGKNFIDGEEKSDSDLIIEATGHDYGTLIKESGKRDHYHCSVCGKYFDENYNEITVLVLPEGHTFSAWTAEKPATCTQEGTKGYYTCSDAGCAGKYFDINYNEIDDITIPAGHKWASEPGYDEEEHYFVCTECFAEKDHAEHDLTTEYIKEDGIWYEYQKCTVCAYKSEGSSFDMVVGISPVRSFLVDRYDLYSFYTSVLYEDGSTSEESIISYLDTDAFYNMVLELKEAGVFPVTKSVTLSMRNFTKDVEITFDIYRTEAVPEYSVYQQGYLTDLGDMRIKFVSNSGYNSGYICLSHATITDDGGFDPDYDFADGDKVYNVSFTYNEEAYTFSFAFVDRAVVRKMECYDGQISLGTYPKIKMEYTDDTFIFTEVLATFDMLDGSFDNNTPGKQTFTLQTKEGYVKATFTVDVVDRKSISDVDNDVFMALGDSTFKVMVCYGDGTCEYLTLTTYAITNPDRLNDGNVFDNLKVGKYCVTVRIKDYDADLYVSVYDPNNVAASYIEATFSGPLICESDLNGNVIIDFTGLYIVAYMNDGTVEYVQLSDDIIIVEEDCISVTYKGATTSFLYKIAEKGGNDFYVCTKENSNVRRMFAKDGVFTEEYFLRVSAYNGGYYYVPVTSDMIYLDSEKFDMSTADSKMYYVRVAYGVNLTTDAVSLVIYTDSDVLQSINGGEETAICGSYDYVISQIEKMYFFYSEYVYFPNICYATIFEEQIDFNDVIVGDVSEYDFTKPGKVNIPLSYNGVSYTLELMLVPNLSLYECEKYTMTIWNYVYVAQVYEMGYIIYDGSTYAYEVCNAECGIWKIDDCLYLVNEEEKTIVRFRGSMLGTEPTVYFFQGEKIEIYTENGISYADFYYSYGDDYVYDTTITCILGEDTVVIMDIKFVVVPGTNELAVAIEGEPVYTYKEGSASYYMLYQFNDDGRIYLFQVTINDETNEEITVFVDYADWEQTDDVITIIYDDIPVMKFSVDADGNLTPIA